jgi:AcrR family transcriptional regulator
MPRKSATAPTTQTEGRSYRGASAESRRAGRRNKLLDAALECFGHKGYHATSVRSICQTAGLTERYFYESFPRSDALLMALYDTLTQQLETRVLSLVDAARPDPLAMSRAALDAYFAFNENPRVARVTHLEILGVNADIDRRYRASMQRFASLIASVLNDAAPDADTNKAQQHLVATGLVGAAVQITTQWFLDDYRASRAEVVASAHRLFSAVLAQQAPASEPAKRRRC